MDQISLFLAGRATDYAGRFVQGTYSGIDGHHALCWVHAERLVHKLEMFTDQQRHAQQHVRGLIWWFDAI